MARTDTGHLDRQLATDELARWVAGRIGDHLRRLEETGAAGQRVVEHECEPADQQQQNQQQRPNEMAYGSHAVSFLSRHSTHKALHH
jgi:hypothetical protein